MKNLLRRGVVLFVGLAILGFLVPLPARAADHNDPNSINSIFSDIKADPADLYDLFGWPSDDVSGGEKVIVALTFASVPATGVFDTDMLYRILLAPSPRVSSGLKDDESFTGMLRYFRALEEKYVGLKPAEIRVTVDKEQKARIEFGGFQEGAGGTFSTVVSLNQVSRVDTPNGFAIKAYIGGRDDAFFNDLPGFFRSINYGPQFYYVPEAKKEARELKIPKTLLELDGNKLFNFDPANPEHGQGKKLPLPDGPLTWNGTKFLKDEKGNFRFVYSGRDAQAGRNINAIILEIPLAFITSSPGSDRIVNAWGESWVLKASGKIAEIPADRAPVARPFWLEHPWVLPGVLVLVGLLFLFWGLSANLRRRSANPGTADRKWKTWLKAVGWTAAGLVAVLVGLIAGGILTKIGNKKPVLALSQSELDDELRKFKLIDTDGQPFADAALNERESDKQLGAFNFSLALPLVTRLAHLGWGFGPSIQALGLRSSFDCGDASVSVHKTYSSALAAFPRSRKVLFQKLNMPDDKWKKRAEVDIPLKRSLEIFVPNVCPIDMDTTGTWPYGRRPEDQVATRFLSLFLDMEQTVAGRQCNIESLNDPALWASAPIEPKVPPNPLKNDKEFLKEFPYLAEPWP
ncbi:MAG: hypothetical protein QOH01_1279 [Verrucomicrobiota bacterium]|jgi:hypothetical protein